MIVKKIILIGLAILGMFFLAGKTYALPVPSGPNVTEVTGDDRANAFVTLGSVVTGGDQMALVMNFPAYEAAVDIYAAVQLPDGNLYLVKSDGSLTTELKPYAQGVTAAQSATILDSFDVCMPFGASVPTGTWNVYSVVAPTNGGDFSGIDFTSGDYNLWFYSFDVTCSSTENFTGEWTLVVKSTTDYDINMDPCGNAVGTMSVTNNQFSIILYTVGASVTADGNIGDDGTINTTIAKGPYGAGIFSGKLSGNSGNGTWEDIYECSGTWTATKQ